MLDKRINNNVSQDKMAEFFIKELGGPQDRR